LAKAIATECKSALISVNPADLLLKWHVVDGKFLKALFELARERQPCIVFIDEIDVLYGQRTDTESEALRRIKTEFLVQMDGMFFVVK
jgi:SpoVK/Ycf46/Vps4 family AAA+-type ATPase